MTQQRQITGLPVDLMVNRHEVELMHLTALAARIQMSAVHQPPRQKSTVVGQFQFICTVELNQMSTPNCQRLRIEPIDLDGRKTGTGSLSDQPSCEIPPEGTEIWIVTVAQRKQTEFQMRQVDLRPHQTLSEMPPIVRRFALPVRTDDKQETATRLQMTCRQLIECEAGNLAGVEQSGRSLPGQRFRRAGLAGVNHGPGGIAVEHSSQAGSTGALPSPGA